MVANGEESPSSGTFSRSRPPDPTSGAGCASGAASRAPSRGRCGWRSGPPCTLRGTWGACPERQWWPPARRLRCRVAVAQHPTHNGQHRSAHLRDQGRGGRRVAIRGRPGQRKQLVVAGAFLDGSGQLLRAPSHRSIQDGETAIVGQGAQGQPDGLAVWFVTDRDTGQACSAATSSQRPIRAHAIPPLQWDDEPPSNHGN